LHRESPNEGAYQKRRSQKEWKRLIEGVYHSELFFQYEQREPECPTWRAQQFLLKVKGP